ncbi:ubiquinol-cytochrome c reductase iron-sulfur subunit [Bailinhaonella thermotolerans]|uniref:Cytochrome bc1 complex Rieske iron-sulfur subunit n=1 Tax=Bailinhaonella thermotolerans TaxID=1070861 RepID=A0A3A4AQQ4_9ACTN|nr:Rieske (2Fe-2S) protein [Bailinhaonella thermotolerans]RJL31421.1 (2Fe-2S)-binding protein [Bailinhaonella thermotolerans]
MTDNTNDINEPGEERVPKRILGTPPSEGGYLVHGEQIDESREAPGIYVQDPDKARRTEKYIALSFLITFLAGIGFIVSYVVFQVGDLDSTAVSNATLGGTLALALLGLAVGITLWVRGIMPKYEITEKRKVLAPSPEQRSELNQIIIDGAQQSGLGRFKLVRRTLLLAAAPLGLLPIVLLRDLGPMPKTALRHTVWKKGLRLVVEGTGQPIRAADFNSPGGILSVVPHGYEHDMNALAKATLILIKLRPEEIQPPTKVENWTVNGIVAYSKICTHVGCPAALYEQTTHHILCPCHQSTFDATRGAEVVFGPAARPLPQLPIGVDNEGYLIALSDFEVPVGPSFWERGDAEKKVREGEKA